MKPMKKKAQSSLFPVRLSASIKAAMKSVRLETVLFAGIALGIILATTISAFS